MDCPHCGTPCTCSVPSVAARIVTSRGTLATSECVDAISVLNSLYVRDPMQSSEPIVPRGVPSDQTDENDEAWRAEVASRVDSYRARRMPDNRAGSPKGGRRGIRAKGLRRLNR